MTLTAAGLIWPVIAFGFPMAAIATYLILRTCWNEIGSGGDGNREVEKAHRAIAIRFVLFIVGLHVLVLLNFGGAEWLRFRGPRIVVVLFGAAFIAIGNLLPRTRPNLAFGIRTSRTLTDRSLWIRVHRTCGYVSVALGAVIVMAGLFVSGRAIGPVVAAAALIALAVLFATYRRLRNG